MQKLRVQASKAYSISIGGGMLNDAGAIIRAASGGDTAAVIADDQVAELYAKRLVGSLSKSGYRPVLFVFPHGEASKNAQTYLSVLNFLAQSELGRADVVVALGGGVTGDLAGFAAATYMRGVRFAQIPTSLLAMVDSSVGGKTAVNLPAGKNLTGAFYPPDAVICDPDLLRTLPDEFFADGCAEIIKHGVISGGETFRLLKTPIKEQLEDVIAKSIAVKRDIIAVDEFENGPRKLLNLGHTVGHAIELLSGYTTSHGHAVAAGLAVVARAGVARGYTSLQCAVEIETLLRAYHLPVATDYAPARLAEACMADKKREGGHITMAFPAEIGSCTLCDIPMEELPALIASGMEAIT